MNFVRAVLYQGSLNEGVEPLDLRLRYTLGEERNSFSSIYASDLLAFAVAHSFAWSSDEGMDLYVDEGFFRNSFFYAR